MARGRTQHESWIKVEEARRAAAQPGNRGNDFYSRPLPPKSRPKQPSSAPTGRRPLTVAELAERLGRTQAEVLSAIWSGDIRVMRGQPGPRVDSEEAERVVAFVRDEGRDGVR